MFRWWNFLPVLFWSDLYDWLNLVFIFILYFSRVPYDHKIHFNHVFIAIICVSILTVKKGNSILYFLCLLPFSASPLWCHWCLSQICSNKPQPGVDSLCLFPFRTRGRSNRSVLARGCKTEGWIFSSLDVFYFAEIQGEKNTFLKMGRIWKKKKTRCNIPKLPQGGTHSPTICVSLTRWLSSLSHISGFLSALWGFMATGWVQGSKLHLSAVYLFDDLSAALDHDGPVPFDGWRHLVVVAQQAQQGVLVRVSTHREREREIDSSHDKNADAEKKSSKICFQSWFKFICAHESDDLLSSFDSRWTVVVEMKKFKFNFSQSCIQRTSFKSCGVGIFTLAELPSSLC